MDVIKYSLTFYWLFGWMDPGMVPLRLDGKIRVANPAQHAVHSTA